MRKTTITIIVAGATYSGKTLIAAKVKEGLQSLGFSVANELCDDFETQDDIDEYVAKAEANNIIRELANNVGIRIINQQLPLESDGSVLLPKHQRLMHYDDEAARTPFRDTKSNVILDIVQEQEVGIHRDRTFLQAIEQEDGRVEYLAAAECAPIEAELPDQVPVTIVADDQAFARFALLEVRAALADTDIETVQEG